MAYLSNSLTESDRDVPEVVFFQSNSESDIVEILQKAATTDSQDSHSIDGIVLNCAAYTHTSVAIRDALLLCRQLPSVEVHLSNVHAREEFRKQSLLSDVVDAVICGLGWRGYLAACQWIDEQIALKG